MQVCLSAPPLSHPPFPPLNLLVPLEPARMDLLHTFSSLVLGTREVFTVQVPASQRQANPDSPSTLGPQRVGTLSVFFYQYFNLLGLVPPPAATSTWLLGHPFLVRALLAPFSEVSSTRIRSFPIFPICHAEVSSTRVDH